MGLGAEAGSPDLRSPRPCVLADHSMAIVLLHLCGGAARSAGEGKRIGSQSERLVIDTMQGAVNNFDIPSAAADGYV